MESKEQGIEIGLKEILFSLVIFSSFLTFLFYFYKGSISEAIELTFQILISLPVVGLFVIFLGLLIKLIFGDDASCSIYECRECGGKFDKPHERYGYDATEEYICPYCGGSSFDYTKCYREKQKQGGEIML